MRYNRRKPFLAQTGMAKKIKDAYLMHVSKEPNIRKVIRFGEIAWITKRKKKNEETVICPSADAPCETSLGNDLR